MKRNPKGIIRFRLWLSGETRHSICGAFHIVTYVRAVCVALQITFLRPVSGTEILADG